MYYAIIYKLTVLLVKVFAFGLVVVSCLFVFFLIILGYNSGILTPGFSNTRGMYNILWGVNLSELITNFQSHKYIGMKSRKFSLYPLIF